MNENKVFKKTDKNMKNEWNRRLPCKMIGNFNISFKLHVNGFRKNK